MSSEPAPRRDQALPAILIAALVQGTVLYVLHRAIEDQFWPATDLPWLLGLYALAVFVPPSVQLMAEHARRWAMWRLLGLMAMLLFGFGWYHGHAIAAPADNRFALDGEYFPLAFLLLVWWLLVLPFVQSRLAAGRWTLDYQQLFAHAWRNKIALAEAALFTGLFWLILQLWQTLFHMLGIDYFRELFRKAPFVYPVTALAFGTALQLVGSIERLVSTVLEQILNVLKWLALVAAVLLTLFTLTLLAKLPGLVFTGQRAVGATWLLWLVAVQVLLLNAAYRDGTVAHPYPRWPALALRCALPLTVVIAGTALFALGVRTWNFGLTVERFWGFVVGAAALCYALGYSRAALDRRHWFGGLTRVNVGVALGLIAMLSAALTPLLSPYRLAANSQYRQALLRPAASAGPGGLRGSPFQYLRFDSGRYGLERLKALSQLQSGENAVGVRAQAVAALAQSNPWNVAPHRDFEAALAQLPVFPSGRSLDGPLRALLHDELSRTPGTALPIAGLFIDLDGDGSDEFVLLSRFNGWVFQQRGGRWQLAGHLLAVDFAGGAGQAVLDDLAKGDFSARAPEWKQLWIGNRQFRVQ
jgi:hypothetical protein